jgi:3'-phosphoadenosine 5'-phosphosulfate sulfotransferase (PAPS reductase)/FAD synthetase
MSKIIVPVSGGKDSTATLLLALEDGREVIPVFNETGWDHPDTYAYLQYLEDKTGLTIQKTHYAEAPTMPDIIRRVGRFPFGLGRFCTSEYKRTAFIRWLDTVEGEFEIWLGIREDESGQRRRKYGDMDPEDLYDMDVLFPRKFPKRLKERMKYRLPMLEHTREEIFALIHSKGFKHNPLYDQGFDRVGCFPCLLAGEKTQKLAFETEFGKKQFKIIQILEEELGVKYKFQPEGSPCGECKI